MKLTIRSPKSTDELMIEKGDGPDRMRRYIKRKNIKKYSSQWVVWYPDGKGWTREER